MSPRLVYWTRGPYHGMPTPKRIRDEAARLGWEDTVHPGHSQTIDQRTGQWKLDELVDYCTEEIKALGKCHCCFDHPIVVDLEFTRWMFNEEGPISGAEYIKGVRNMVDRLRREFPMSLPGCWLFPFARSDTLTLSHFDLRECVSENCLVAHMSAVGLDRGWAEDKWSAYVAWGMDFLSQRRRPAYVKLPEAVTPYFQAVRRGTAEVFPDEHQQMAVDLLKPFNPAWLFLWSNSAYGAADMTATEAEDAIIHKMEVIAASVAA